MHILSVFFLPFFGLGFVIYFLPTILAFARNKRDTAAMPPCPAALASDAAKSRRCRSSS